MDAKDDVTKLSRGAEITGRGWWMVVLGGGSDGGGGVYLAHFSLQVRWPERVTAERLDLDALCRAVVCLATTSQKMMSSGGIC